MFINDGYAVLIGVDDYSAFDASRKLPAGTTSLAGSINDVKAWWKQCRLLGMQPAQIRVLTSPPIDFKTLDGATSENVAPATEAEIRATVGWLAGKLAQPSQPTGLLTFSGHGDWLEGKGPVVCPSDVTFVEGQGGAVGLAHALSYGDLNALIGQHGDNLTAVLDCCHTGGARDGDAGLPLVSTNTGRPLSLTSRPMPRGGSVAAHETQLAGRVLSAAGRSQLAYQAKFDGVDRGAFSWSLTSAMDQWRGVQGGRGVQLDVAYGKLVETSRRLVDALWFPQTPALHGPPGLAKLAVFQQGLTPKAGQTTPRPNGTRKPLQLDPGLDIWMQYEFQFNDSNATTFATVILVNTTQFSGFTTGTEYWYVNLGSIGLLGSYSLNCYQTEYGSSPAPVAPKYSGGMQSFTLAESPGWGSGWTTDPVSGGYLFSSWAFSGVYLRVATAYSGGSYKVSQLTWYQVLSSGSPANIAMSGHMPATSGSVSVSSGYTGYDISQAT